jgi:COP9 signalosome complex subunit 7
MEVEQKQADLVHQFVLLARDARGRAAAELITHATSNPQLFAFSELLSCSHIAELKGTEHSGALDLLRLFAYGIWSDYKSNAQLLPVLEPQQELKLKQLTVMTLAERYKVRAHYVPPFCDSSSIITSQTFWLGLAPKAPGAIILL